jgi:hypothetical protein
LLDAFKGSSVNMSPCQTLQQYHKSELQVTGPVAYQPSSDAERLIIRYIKIVHSCFSYPDCSAAVLIKYMYSSIYFCAPRLAALGGLCNPQPRILAIKRTLSRVQIALMVYSWSSHGNHVQAHPIPLPDVVRSASRLISLPRLLLLFGPGICILLRTINLTAAFHQP